MISYDLQDWWDALKEIIGIVRDRTENSVCHFGRKDHISAEDVRKPLMS